MAKNLKPNQTVNFKSISRCNEKIENTDERMVIASKLHKNENYGRYDYKETVDIAKNSVTYCLDAGVTNSMIMIVKKSLLIAENLKPNKITTSETLINCHILVEKLEQRTDLIIDMYRNRGYTYHQYLTTIGIGIKTKKYCVNGGASEEVINRIGYLYDYAYRAPYNSSGSDLGDFLGN